MQARTSCFVHCDGVPKTIELLKEAMRPQKHWLVEMGPGYYSSNDFKTGIDVGKLNASRQVLGAFVGIDPRGAIFAHSHMLQAAAAVLVGDDFDKLCNLLQKTQSELHDLFAYKIRVVTLHLRICWDTSTHAEHLLEDLFKTMADTGAPTSN